MITSSHFNDSWGMFVHWYLFYMQLKHFHSTYWVLLLSSLLFLVLQLLWKPSSVPCCCRQIPSTSLVWLYLYPQIEKHLKNVGNTRVEMDSFVCPPVHLFVRPSVCLTICPSVLLIEWNNIKREETPRPWYKNKNI